MKKLLVAMALGAGAAYFFDPDNGGRRRLALQRKIDRGAGSTDPVRPVAVPNDTRVSSVL